MINFLCKCCELNQKDDFDIIQTELKIDKILKERTNKMNMKNKSFNNYQYTNINLLNNHNFNNQVNELNDSTEDIENDNQISENISLNNMKYILDKQKKFPKQNITNDDHDMTILKDSSFCSQNFQDIDIFNMKSCFELAFRQNNRYSSIENNEYYIDLTNSSLHNKEISNTQRSEKYTRHIVNIDSSFKINKNHIRQDELNMRFTIRGIIEYYSKLKDNKSFQNTKSEYFYNKDFVFKYNLYNEEKTFTNRVIVEYKNNSLMKKLDLNHIKEIILNNKKICQWNRMILLKSDIEEYENYRIIKYEYSINEYISFEKEIFFEVNNSIFIFSSSINHNNSNYQTSKEAKYIYYRIYCLSEVFDKNNISYIRVELYEKSDIIEFNNHFDYLQNFKLLYYEL